MTGTSLSAPHVTGALALLLDAFPSILADDQQNALKSGGVDLGAAGPDNRYGFGRLDALAAYDWLATGSDFAITASPSAVSTRPGGSVVYSVSVTLQNGFTGAVALSLSGLTSSEASWSFVPPAISGGSGSSQLTVTTSSSIAPGSYPLTITGTSGAVVHSASTTLVVTVPSDFGLSISPATRSVKRGSSTTYTVTVSSQGGFSGVVSLSAAGLPAGATVTFTPASVTAPGTSTMTVKTLKTTPRGTYQLTVTGTDGALSHQTTASLTVK